MRRLLVLLLLFTGGCAPYMVTRDFRGDNSARAFYIYPPGSRPWRTVRAAEVATRQQCSATRHTTTSFELTYRTRRGVRTAVVRDAGNVPASKAAFDLELESLLTNSCL
ncbi:MAG TPA: hypothetical protein VHK90_05600, partial [Thermoanaerobaculia bacterium]|nr:hypothetical protein [Thermoanaerobaculia bacterium]